MKTLERSFPDRPTAAQKDGTDTHQPACGPNARTPPSFEGGVSKLVAGERNQLNLLLQAAA